MSPRYRGLGGLGLPAEKHLEEITVGNFLTDTSRLLADVTSPSGECGSKLSRVLKAAERLAIVEAHLENYAPRRRAGAPAPTTPVEIVEQLRTLQGNFRIAQAVAENCLVKPEAKLYQRRARYHARRAIHAALTRGGCAEAFREAGSAAEQIGLQACAGGRPNSTTVRALEAALRARCSRRAAPTQAVAEDFLPDERGPAIEVEARIHTGVSPEERRRIRLEHERATLSPEEYAERRRVEAMSPAQRAAYETARRRGGGVSEDEAAEEPERDIARRIRRLEVETAEERAEREADVERHRRARFRRDISGLGSSDKQHSARVEPGLAGTSALIASAQAAYARGQCVAAFRLHRLAVGSFARAATERFSAREKEGGPLTSQPSKGHVLHIREAHVLGKLKELTNQLRVCTTAVRQERLRDDRFETELPAVLQRLRRTASGSSIPPHTLCNDTLRQVYGWLQRAYLADCLSGRRRWGPRIHRIYNAVVARCAERDPSRVVYDPPTSDDIVARFRRLEIDGLGRGRRSDRFAGRRGSAPHRRRSRGRR